MNTLTTVIGELKKLPPSKLEVAAEYVRNLGKTSRARRDAVLRSTAGCLPGATGKSFAKAIEDGCERIDSNGW